MAYDKDNIFAKIIRGEIPCKKVYEDNHALAFHDIQPSAPVHVLVIPKGDYVSAYDFANTPAELQAGFWVAVQKTVDALNLRESGFRIIANHGQDAGQIVFHFHVHILGGAPLGKLVTVT